MANLTLRDKDIHGYIPDTDLIGCVLRHTGNGQTYTVTGFCWIGDTDEWGVLHEGNDSEAVFVRSLNDFYGCRGNNRARFELITSSDSQPHYRYT